MSKPRKAARKRPVPRKGLVREHNGGLWTSARKRAFIVSALRGARWPPKYKCIRSAYIGDGPNPATGRRCKLHQCPECNGVFPQNLMAADHITPVVGPEGFVDWNTFIERLFVEKECYQAVCKGCHKSKSKAENDERRNNKRTA